MDFIKGANFVTGGLKFGTENKFYAFYLMHRKENS